jgi:hypothetical protein
MTSSTTTPTVNSLTNTTPSLQLEDSGGNFTTSNATTTLMFSAPSGFFATSAGSTGTSTPSVTFPSGVGTATVYIGNQTSGSDVITTNNGTNVWATSTLTFVASTASQIQITLAPPTNLQTSPTTNIAVTLQLQDQYGNAVHTSGVALTLINSGSGYFTTQDGVVKVMSSTSLGLTTNALGVATGYFGDANTESGTITASGTGLSSSTSPFNDSAQLGLPP